MANIRQLKEGDDVTVFYPQTHLKAVIDSGGNTLDEILENLEPGGSTDAVKYTPQTLTTAQKAQARTNIDAPSTADVAAKQDTISDLSAIRSGAAAGATAYQKPQTGIPASDLASGIGNEEDIDQNTSGKLQFADRVYDSQNPNGMGYVILRKNKTFAEQVTGTNTIYEIRYDFDLNNATVTIPAGCTLKFNGGKIANGILVGNSTAIDASTVQIFSVCQFNGTWNVDAAPIEWYGTKRADANSVCAAIAINSLQEISGNVILGNGRYFATTATTINLKGKLTGAAYRQRGEQFGTSLEFRSVASGFVGIQIGVADGGVSDRIREATLENLNISLTGFAGVLSSAVLHVGAVGVVNLRQCSFTNNNVRNSALSSSEFLTPENYSNYGIVLSGNSEFLRMFDCGVVADIPVYSRSTAVFDFTQITRCGFDAGAYGFASFYGVALSGSDFLSVSMNRGIYGVCWEEPTGNYLNGNISFLGGRIEQLSDYRVDGFMETCSVKIKTKSFAYNTKKLDFLFSGVFFPTVNAIRIVGDNEIYATFVACAGLNISNNVPAIDIYSSPRANVRCLNSPFVTKSSVRLDPTKHLVSGLKINNQQSDSYAGALYDLCILPICPLSSIRQQQHVHFVAANNRQYDVRLEQTLPTGLTYPFIDRIRLWDSDNKAVGYILELTAIAPGVLAKAKYVIKYAADGETIDPTSGTVTVYAKEGDDIFSSATNDADKLNIYIGSGTGSPIQLYANNRVGKSIHVVGKLSAFTTEELF